MSAYTLTRICVVPLVVNDNNPPQVLIGQKHVCEKKLSGEWHFPGGNVRNMESVFDAAKREVFEETGLKIVPKEILCVSFHVDRSEKHIVWITTSHEPGQEPVPSDDLQAVKWVDCDKVEDQIGFLAKEEVPDEVWDYLWSLARP